MKILFAVPWIEVEYGWGGRPEGFKIFDNLEECISSSKESSATGNYKDGSGYCGPQRPLYYYETTDEIDISKNRFVDTLHFKSNPIMIK